MPATDPVFTGSDPFCRHGEYASITGWSALGSVRWGRAKVRELALAAAMLQGLSYPFERKGWRRSYEAIEHAPETDVERLFRELADQWTRETAHVSSIPKVVMHPAYQQIIGLGHDVLPLLLRSLTDRPGYWFWALEMVARETPVTKEIAGQTKNMKRAWLDWGIERGLVR